ncbi:metalloregulator ArsR/SmtB family transcription factor [uncultured Sphaerochaeta sp.]|uniref:ArsR/SmtB family transcription factor n=1 Tax=uncultured Sphaerochaeta sp. TaxID=886478 RepID=UPI002A0A541D|nr:metalloregulator ArsR/SmtB family transcription factor [uncultured Sphaerochaeta sp.]
MELNYASYISKIKALSDVTRLKIIDMLSCGPLCACDILSFFSISQPTLSYHMGLLTACHLVDAQRNGSWMTYSLNKGQMQDLQKFLTTISEQKDHCICKSATSTGKACSFSKED